MKKLSIYLAIFCLLLIPAFGVADELGIIRLSLIEGNVQVLIQDTTGWTPATINLPMNEHDRLWVPDNSRVELQIQGGVYTRAEGNTALDILTLNRESVQFYLDQGHIYINNRRNGMRTVQVDTSMASFRSYDNTVMMVDVAEDGVTEISVFEGIVNAESRAGAVSVSAGNTLTIRGENSADISPISPPDQWEQWNMDRDRELTARNESSRYLPDELHEYASDFDQYGRWDYVSDYGYVWLPSVTVANWAPYTYGSWVWIRSNYVWVDYHPWGWAPSHYGRWTFIASRGWCWVPPAFGAVYWAPGYVGWVVTPTYVAWVPLAPGEIYYGYGYYGPGSVNIATVNINTVIVSRTYRNANVNNSVVVVRRDTFGTGRRTPVRVQENPFHVRQGRTQNIDIVPPRARPEKRVVLAPPEVRQHTDQMRQQARPNRRAITQMPPAISGDRERRDRAQRPDVSPRGVSPSLVQPGQQQQLPPERVQRNRPENMKNERPLVRQRGASVFKQQQPDNLPTTRSKEPRVINRRPQPHSQPGIQGQSSRPEQQVQPQQQQTQPRQREKEPEARRQRRVR